jgi:hypothetical protein
MTTVTQSESLEQRRRFLAEATERAWGKLNALSGDTRLITLAARAGYALAKEEDGIGSIPGHDPQHVYCARLAAETFPLPPKRVLREEPDPNKGEVWWRYTGLGLEFSPWKGQNGTQWIPLNRQGAYSRTFAATPERIDLWHSLKHEPFREVPDEGDE